MPRFCWDFSSISVFFFRLSQTLTISTVHTLIHPIFNHLCHSLDETKIFLYLMCRSLCALCSLCIPILIHFQAGWYFFPIFFVCSFICCLFAHHHHLIFSTNHMRLFVSKTVEKWTQFDVAQIHTVPVTSPPPLYLCMQPKMQQHIKDIGWCFRFFLLVL